jgi:hypothetical protein
MSDYSDSEQAPASEAAAPAPAPVEKKKREGKKLSDKQKEDLTKHMNKMKKDGMSSSEMKSHRMKLMSRMRKDPKTTARKAHKDIMGK